MPRREKYVEIALYKVMRVDYEWRCKGSRFIDTDLLWPKLSRT